MKIIVDTKDPASVQEALAFLQGGSAPTAPTAPTPPAPTPIPLAPTGPGPAIPQPVGAVPTLSMPTAPVAPAAPAGYPPATQAEVQAAAQAAAARKGSPTAVIPVLTEMGYASFDQVPQDRYGELVARLNAIV